MEDLTAFQRDCLHVIASHHDEEEGPHGLGVQEELEQYRTEEIHHGRLYPNLNDLVDKGLVSKSEIDRRTNAYGITQRGLRELKARREWEDKLLDLEDV